MALIIDLSDNTEQLSTDQLTEIEQLLQFAAQHEKVTNNTELSVLFVSNEEITQLNNEYRHKNMPTDVLSFPMAEDDDDFQLIFANEGQPRLLGDIIISLDKAREQAEQYGHTLRRELAFLAVHGLLHLLGYDHETDTDEQIMFNKQKDILQNYGIDR